MQPDKARDRKPRSNEHQVADSTRASVRKPQARLLQQEMESGGSATQCGHGEDRWFDSQSNPPQYDRAG